VESVDSAALTSRLSERLRPRLQRLYDDGAGDCLRGILAMAEAHAARVAARPTRKWDEREVVLITYGDMVREAGVPTLASLRTFLLENRLEARIRAVHLLPFFPYSSDDGFSVTDYRKVDPSLGDWSHIERLGESFQLMFDLVLNHCSQKSAWFQKYLEGEEPYTHFFVEADPAADLSEVVRPRSSPLLTPFETSRGARHVWTTFSADQVDLNFAHPDVLVEMLSILLRYIERGAKIIRLDAIAYLWKEIGTPCIHLPQTHEVVKLMRDLVEVLAPGTLLLTETNVPHAENVSYFGDGDEAHMVYQFSLAPLLLDTFLSGDAAPLRDWLARLDPSPPGTTFFNFTASHDGIGVRPLEGLVSEDRFKRLVQQVRERGGLVSTRRKSDGTDAPYELNITYFDALGAPGMPVEMHVRRFLGSQAVMLALQGVPGIYFPSLVGAPNDQEGVRRTGAARSINRRKYGLAELRNVLANPRSPQRMVFEGYNHLLETRIAQSAFHPDGAQTILELTDPAVLGFVRTSPNQAQRIVVLANVGPDARDISVPLPGGEVSVGGDLLHPATPISAGEVHLEPYQVAWLPLVGEIAGASS